MNKNAQDIMMGAPSEVTEAQLKELHIKVTLDEEAAAADKDSQGEQ